METVCADVGGGLGRQLQVDGAAGLGTAELVTLLWSPEADAGERAAQELLERADIAALGHARVGELVARHGLPTTRAMRLAAALALGSRAASPPAVARLRLAHPSDVACVMAPAMVSLPRERVAALVLDRQSRLLSRHVVAEGWREGAPMDPREVFRPAVVERGMGVVLVHNHPSGTAAPSPADRETTRRLAQAGGALGVRLVDHVIVAAGGYASLAAEGLCG